MKRFLSACVILMTTVWILPAHAQDADEVAALKQANDELRAELDRVKQAYDTLEAETAQLRAELAKLQMTNEDLEVEKQELTELAGLTPQGERVASAQARFSSTYDEQADQTTVRSEQQSLAVTRGSAADHVFSLAYVYDGAEMLTPPDQVTLFIQARFSGGVYRDVDTAVFDIDGETVEVPIAHYENAARRARIANKRTTRKDDETLTIKIDRDLLRRLARAVQFKVQVGTVHLAPTRDQTALFRAIRKRIELGA